MSSFKLSVNTTEPKAVSAALGVAPATKLDANDINKAVKLAANDNYVLCANGDDIEGTVASINPDTVNDGFAFGSVDTEGRRVATVDAGEVGAITVGATVVAGTQAAITVAGGLVITSGTPALINWRVISILSGTGVAGDSVLIEKV